MAAENEELYGGKPYVWGGRTYLFAPIGLGWIKRVVEISKKISTMSNDEAQQAMFEVIARSLRRNYPGMTDDYIVDEILDASNLLHCYFLALEASGLQPRGKAPAGVPEPSATSTS